MAPGVVHQTRSRLACATQCLSALRKAGSRNGWPITKGCSEIVITSGCARHCSIHLVETVDDHVGKIARGAVAMDDRRGVVELGRVVRRELEMPLELAGGG